MSVHIHIIVHLQFQHDEGCCCDSMMIQIAYQTLSFSWIIKSNSRVTQTMVIYKSQNTYTTLIEFLTHEIVEKNIQ